MYEQHFNLSRSPFSIAPDPSFLYLSGAHREALAHLMYGLANGGFVMITGEVGTGKTTLLRNLLKQTPPDLDVAFILNPRLTVRELLATLCDELGIRYDPAAADSVKQFTDLITRHLLATHRAGRSTVMIIDEAQNLSPAVLEQVRLLTNLETDDRKLLRIILIGQPELGELLSRRELRQLEQRITARYHLGTLNRPETYAYVMHRMSRAGGNPRAFSRAALRRIYALSRGTPRIINVVADRALLGAFTEGKHQVTRSIVNRAAREVLGRPTRQRRWWLAAGVAATIAGAAWALLGPLPLPGLPAPHASNPDPAPPSQAPTPAEALALPGEGAVSAGPVLRHDAASQPQAAAPVANSRAGAEPDVQAPEVITPATYAELEAHRRQAVLAAAQAEAGDVVVTGQVGRPAGSAFANHRRAYGAVFESWGVDFSSVSDEQIPCDFAPTAGLQCLSGRGDWRELASLDLPVVLELWDDQPTPYYAALLGLATDSERVTLQVGPQRLETTRAALKDSWAGAYVVLWQTPPSYYGNLREGQTHETVGWLRQQLTALMERPLDSNLPNYFDENLERAVVEFQRSEGLLTDGIVGPATWIRLAARLRLPQPTLTG